MTAVEAQEQEATQVRASARPDWRERLHGEPSVRTALLCLIGLAVVSAAARAGMTLLVHAPTVFSDEIGYEKLAQSIGEHGRLALLNNQGLSYSPLYPVVLSPLYALGVSAPTAYTLTKVINAVLMSLAVFPIYGIARFALPRRLSLCVAGVAATAPLMLYPSFTMSENLAYPMCLLAIWAMLVAVERPSFRSDLVLVVAIAFATAARIQLVVLFPAALTAIAIAALVGRRTHETVGGALRRACSVHWLLLGVVAAGLLLAGATEATGHDALAAFGRYANVGRNSLPSFSLFLKVLARHIAAVDLAVGVVPFVAALVIAFAFVRSDRRRERIGFASVAVAVSAWFVLEVAYDAAVFDSPLGDIPRIHERFLIYLVPLFLVAPFAAYQISARTASYRVFVGSAVIATLLPLAIPFQSMVNTTIPVDTFSLTPFAHSVHGKLESIQHATIVAVWVAATLSLLYVQVRYRLRAVVTLLLIVLIGISVVARTRIVDGSDFARTLLPTHTDWVDRAHPAGKVVLVTTRPPAVHELETAYANKSISRLYYFCKPSFGAEFGEQRVTIARAGRLRGPIGDIVAPYVVGPTNLRLRGRVVARNPAGHEVLVAPVESRVAVKVANVRCR